MKLWSDISKKDKITLHCSHCRNNEFIASEEINSDTKNFICTKCKNSKLIFSKDFIKKKNEMEKEYNSDDDFKIGQKIFHNIFSDSGKVIDKTNNSIMVLFEENGLKKLAINQN